MAGRTEVRRRAALAITALGACAAGILAVRSAVSGPSPRETVDAAAPRVERPDAAPARPESVAVERPPRSAPRGARRERTAAAPERAADEVATLGAAAAETVPVSVEPGQAEIRGQVRTPAGYTIPGVMVSASPERRGDGARKLWTRTDDTGHYAFRVPDRQDLAYRVQVAGSSEDDDLRRLIQSMKRAGDLREDGVPPGADRIDFEVPLPGRLNLVVLDADSGLPVDRVGLEWRALGDDETHQYKPGSRGLVTDEDGGLSVALPAGHVEATLSAPGYAAHAAAWDVLPVPGAAPLVVEMSPNTVLQVRVVVAPGLRGQDLNPDIPPVSLENPDGSLHYPANILLVPEEDWPELEGRTGGDEDWARFVFENWSQLEMQNRWLERVDGNDFQARPEPGRYRLVAFPDLTRFDPDVVEVGSEPLEIEVRADAYRRAGDAFDR